MNKIKELRKENKLTISELSAALEIPKTTLNNYENGKRTPRDQETWERLAKYFKVPVSYIMGVDENYLDIGIEAYELLLDKIEKDDYERQRKDLDYRYKALTYFDIEKRNEIIIEACKKFFEEIGIGTVGISLGLLTTIDDTFYSTYLKEVKNNENYLEYIEQLMCEVEEEVESYPVIEIYSIPDPTKKNDSLSFLELSGSISDDLQREVCHLFTNFKEDFNLLKNKYPNDFHKNKKEIHYWNKEDSTGLIGEVFNDKIKTFNGYSKEEIQKILQSANDYFR